MFNKIKSTFGFTKLSNIDLAKISGGKRKKHRCQVYNNGMPTGMYRWC
ncbi:bactofencin A family cationic bacteriocin [Lactiplantibacillus plantarum]|nr:bactofencin A family cationic bacteriocin [Lactiplantibacillus plantarum]MBO2705799.1 hypothetical protein [Lactiplantibacillus plantarum]MDO7795359.1 bactofencin A family cationic bacteriocin [Lactiplantibacillus plantarum]WVI00463.1 bactofencin A family cationic bacteriocin [Lactiplantibacillus plantarum]